jgi:flagellar hook-associated protein 2
VTITISASDTDLVASVKTLVDNYNTFRKKLDDDTAYDSANNQGAVLSGDGAALRLDTDLSTFFSGRILGAGSVQSLGEVGISINDDGTLTFDQATLQAKFAADPQAVQDFFVTEDTGFSAKLTQLIEQLCGEDNSLLAQRIQSLDAKITENQAKIETMNTRLESQRQRLLNEFARVEAAVAKMQANLSILDSISYLWSNSSKSSSSRSSSSSTS